ncbi:MAG: outer membrane beta-barrel protein [Alphaproteobacteria bacterium]|nr:outer membrane beta-barrel protein [Alphaproteobacteria bacterium]
MPCTEKKLVILATIVAAFLLPISESFAVDKGDWLVRLRGIGVIPTSESGGIAPDLLTSGLEPQPAVVPELDITYMATDSIGIELILATSPHDLDGTGAIAGLGKAAETMLLPPTLLLQYHFNSKGKFRPYLGAGINYTISYLENADRSLEAVLGPTSVKADNSLGWAVQAGIDYHFAENWFVNFDVKYIDIGMDVELNSGGTVRTLDVDINPVIVGVGIGYRF